MLKKLFYASASILMLALAYHLGAQTARAQGGTIAAATANQQGGSSYGTYSIVVGRTLYGWNAGYNGIRDAFTVPGTSPVVACDYYGPGLGYALLENGDAWVYSSPQGWIYRGNVFGSPTPAAQQTLGQLKAQYRK